MAKRVTHYNASWEQKDEYSNWLSSGKTTATAFCRVCKSSFNIGYQGVAALDQHAKGTNHQSKMDSMKGQRTFSFTNSETLTMPTLPIAFTHDDLVAKAEIMFMLRLAKYNHSFSSIDELCSTLRAICPNDKVVQDLNIGYTKASYSLTHGIAPYFQSMLRDKIRKAPFYTLLYDESTTTQDVKQMDLLARFWDREASQISCRYLGASFLGHATSRRRVLDRLCCHQVKILD